jgi:Protein of unknown function (DUF2586)/Ubiquitin-activating enzyme E1 FCCH domain
MAARQGVTTIVQDGGLGQTPLGEGNTLVILGCSSIALPNQPVTTASQSTVLSTFGYGPLSELACNVIAATGNEVILIQTPSAVAGSINGANSTPLVVSGATDATPIVLTTTAHGLSTGDVVTVASVGGNTAANGTFVITVVDTTHFSLNGTTGTVPYTSGGTATFNGTQFVGTGTSVMTLTGTPLDSYYFKATCTTAFTVGTTGGQVAISLDAGRTVYTTVNVQTASSIAIPNTGLTLHFAAGTLALNDTFTAVTTEPMWNDGGVTAALNSILATEDEFLDVVVTGTAASGDATSFDGEMTQLFNQARFSCVLCAARDIHQGGSTTFVAGLPTETEQAWMSALQADFANVVSDRVLVTAGHYNFVSAISQSQFRRPLLWGAATRDAAAAISTKLGRVKDGPISNLIVPSAPDGFVLHNETLNPGLDAARFTTLWKIYGKRGFFIKNDNILAGPNSDFNWLVHRHVMDEASAITNDFWTNELSDSLRVDNTGQILKQDAADLIARCNEALATGLVNTGDVSAAWCSIPPNQKILATAQLDVMTNIIPLGYTDAIDNTLTFVNPSVVQVGS